MAYRVTDWLSVSAGPKFTYGNLDFDLAVPPGGAGQANLDIDEQWAVLATVGWEDWSTMSDLLVSTDGGCQSIPRNWKDTYHASIGAHYKPREDWLLQAGFTYGSSPVSSGDRTADMPNDEQYRFAVGAQHQLSETLAVGGSFVYADLGDAKISNPTTLQGDYDTNRALFFSLNLNWKF